MLLEVVPLVMRWLRSGMREIGVDLTVPQFRTLGFLSRREGASLSDVAERLGLTLSPTSKLVELLVARGLVTREPLPDDRRYVALSLTAEGRTLLESSRAAARARMAERLAVLSPEEQAVVERALALLRPLFEEGHHSRSGG